MEGERPKVFGPYVLLKALGRGAMGDVYLARPLSSDRGVPPLVVVKRLHGELVSQEHFVARFRHEAALAVSVDSPHIARVFDVGAVGETLYLTMELVRGWPLATVMEDVVKSGRHASVASVVDLLAGGLEGLGLLHTASDPVTGRALAIVHRDLSPRNLMVREDGKLCVIDLGLGRSNAQEWKTRTGVVMGSVGYMAPEQALGDRVDVRADIYSMAVVGFEMLTLRNYVKRAAMADMMAASVRPQFVPPSHYRPDVPAALDQALEHALQPERDKRTPDARTFLQDLRRAVPASVSSGGLRQLVNELYGAQKAAREAELQRLLQLPIPEEELFDLQPTRVFVTRAGVRPHQVQVQVQEPTPELTRATELARIESDSLGLRVLPVQSDRSRPASRVQARGISPIVFVAGVVLSSALTGLAVLWWRGAPAPQLVPVATAPPLIREVERTEPVAVERPPDATKIEPAPELPEPRRLRPRPESEAVVPLLPPRPPPRAPEPKPEADTLDAELERLSKALAAQKSQQPPEARADLNRLLIELGMERRGTDLEKKRAAVTRFREALRTYGVLTP